MILATILLISALVAASIYIWIARRVAWVSELDGDWGL